MRPTSLDFRAPGERTAEFIRVKHTHNGVDLDLNKKTKNTTGMTMSKEKRFKDQPLYCKGSGATCFLGPGSYNDHEAYIAMRKTSCPAKIVSDY